MITVRVDPVHPDEESIARAAAVLRAGGLVAFPTETVYGLGAHALDEAAVARIFAAKGRPSFNPLIVHVRDIAAARGLAAEWTRHAQNLAEAFWPGPLTLVLPKRDLVPDSVTAGLGSVALRVPAHAVAAALLAASELPLAAPSANRYTEISPTTADHVAKSLGDRIDMLVDGGPTVVGIESTVLDLSGTRPRLLRPGTVSVSEIEAVVGPLDAAFEPGPPDSARPSPGMVRRHYAPRARLQLFHASERQDVAAITRAAAGRRERTGAIVFDTLEAVDFERRMPREPLSYAAMLYAALHEMDDLGCDLVLVERVPDTADWAGVRDRLARAAEQR